MCLTKRANKKVVKLTKIKNNKVYPESTLNTQPTSPKFDVLLEKTRGKKTKTKTI